MNLVLFWNTVKYLKPVQIYGRIWHRFYRPRVPSLSIPAMRFPLNGFISPIEKGKSLISPTRFRFLNQEYDIADASDWNDPSIDKLWLYNLHYFDYLSSGNDEGDDEICHSVIERWINENAPFAGNGWEPYPVSLRIVNWIKWVLAGNKPSRKMAASLYLQGWYLRRKLEIHLLGNHLFANAKALIFAGLFFDGSEAELWLNKGLKILSKQIPEQILGDGGHFERSPMYHSIILEDLLDLINIANVYSGMIPSSILEIWCAKSRKMLSALNKQSHPDGEIAFFNDAATGIAAKPDEIQAYADRLGVVADEEQDSRVGCLSNTGYYSVRRDNWFLIIDAAPVGPDYLPGHAHADTLSFELSMGKQRVLVNSGTSCYEVGQERLRQRQTPAHNTLSVDERDSSEVWSGFRVARRTRIVNREIKSSEEKDVICAAHNGFERLKSVGLHQRTWEFSDGELVISDSVGGSGTHCVRVFFHFHPSLHVKQGGSGQVDIYDDEGDKIVKMKMDERLSISLKDSTYHPEFGLSIPNQVIIGKIETQLPFNISTRLVFV